jgi:hypothetical protein
LYIPVHTTEDNISMHFSQVTKGDSALLHKSRRAQAEFVVTSAYNHVVQIQFSDIAS